MLLISHALELSFAWRLLLAALLGALMGLERSIAGKHAGMRTYALVSLGACLFVVCGTLATYEFSSFGGINPLGIASSIVSGIGFIGAGLAVFSAGHTAELTTAAGLWVVAAVGMACGFGLYLLSLITAVLAVVILAVFTKVEHSLRVRFGEARE